MYLKLFHFLKITIKLYDHFIWNHKEVFQQNRHLLCFYLDEYINEYKFYESKIIIVSFKKDSKEFNFDINESFLVYNFIYSYFNWKRRKSKSRLKYFSIWIIYQIKRFNSFLSIRRMLWLHPRQGVLSDRWIIKKNVIMLLYCVKRCWTIDTLLYSQ